MVLVESHLTLPLFSLCHYWCQGAPSDPSSPQPPTRSPFSLMVPHLFPSISRCSPYSSLSPIPHPLWCQSLACFDIKVVMRGPKMRQSCAWFQWLPGVFSCREITPIGVVLVSCGVCHGSMLPPPPSWCWCTLEPFLVHHQFFAMVGCLPPPPGFCCCALEHFWFATTNLKTITCCVFLPFKGRIVICSHCIDSSLQSGRC